MLKITSFFLAASMFIGASSALAVPFKQYTYAVKPGDNLRIDISGPKDIALVYAVIEEKSAVSKVPSVVVTETYGGFECELGPVKLLKSVDLSAELMQNLYVLNVEWHPGSDSSGCMVQLGTGDNAAYAELYMSY